jgi:ATP-binding protein involved in chromosome partitioning
MRIAIPTTDGKLAMHFGHCEQFTILNVDEEKKTVLDAQSVTPPAHEPGLLPRWLHEQGADIIIAGGMGRRAQDLFAQNGIEVIVGAPAGAPADIAAAHLAGALKQGENVCDH